MKARVTRFSTLWLLLTCACFCSLAQEKNKDQVIEVPFNFVRNEIILEVKINGQHSLNMMLDTGTDPSAVDLSTARELNLKLNSVGRQGSGGGTDVNLTYETKLPLVQLGGLTAKNVEALAIDLSKVTQRLGTPLHGVLGHSLLNGRIVQIDYPNRVVRFYSQSPFSKTADQANSPKRTVMPFKYNDNVLIDDVSVNGKRLVANLDTGSNGNFHLTPAAVSYLGLDDEVSKASVSTGVGYNGIAENREGKLTNVTIGGISVDGPAVVFFAKGAGRDKEPWGLNIGNVFLKDFVLTIDYRSKLVTFERP